MANKPNVIIQNAKKMIADGYVYIYGYKGDKATKPQVERLIALYPKVFTYTIKKLALGKVGKFAIDCSGYVCKASGISHMGSYQIYSSAPSKWSIKNLNHIQNGMFIWRSGHVGIIEIDSKGQKWILEAQGTKTDLKRTKFESRYKSFTHYGMIKGVDYTKEVSKSVIKPAKNPFPQPTMLLKKGMNNEQVRWLKFELKEAGFSITTTNGAFGSKVDKLVKEFQKSCKITVDGIVGKDTVRELIKNK